MFTIMQGTSAAAVSTHYSMIEGISPKGKFVAGNGNELLRTACRKAVNIFYLAIQNVVKGSHGRLLIDRFVSN